jgi:hypothetical protein
VVDNMFVPSFVAIGGKRKYTVLLSIVAHTFVIAAAIMVPLVATDTLVLPARFAMIAIYSRPPLPPSVPPPRRDAREQPPVTRATIPLVAPEAISTESKIPLTSEPVAGFESSVGLVTGT